VTVEQALCDGSSVGMSPAGLACSLLPAAEVVPPRAGQTEVILTGEYIPGSTTRVWSVTDDKEIGDSSGPVINVRPLVAGEILHVMRALGTTCEASSYFVIEVE
jgi:hypothetical protein